MQKRSNNIYMYIISTSLSMATAAADDNNMAGLYIGVGASVGYDEYESKVNVGKTYQNGVKTVTANNLMIGQYGFGNQMEDMAQEENPIEATTLNIKSNDTDKLVNDLWKTEKSGDWDKDNIFINDNLVVASKLQQLDLYDNKCEEDSHMIMEDSCTNGGKKLMWYINKNDQEQANDITEDILYTKNGDAFISLKDLTNDNYHFHVRICNIEQCYSVEGLKSNVTKYMIISTKRSDVDVINSAYYPINLYVKPNMSSELMMYSMFTKPSIVSVVNQPATYLSNQSLRCSGRNSGLEIKMSYFHDLGNNIVAGLDLTGAVLSKNSHNISTSKFDVNNTPTDLSLSGSNGVLATAKYIDGEYHTTAIEGATIEKGDVLQLSNLNAKIAQNPNTSIIIGKLNDEYIDTTKGNKDVHFEKGIFNPKLALVVGGTYNGWFAGIRGGISYNTGKVKTSDMTSCKSVSIASPLVGLQVMKKLSPTANLYMTADWNVGETTKPVNVKGIKTFKQSSYSVSAGVQWRCNLIK